MSCQRIGVKKEILDSGGAFSCIHSFTFSPVSPSYSMVASLRSENRMPVTKILLLYPILNPEISSSETLINGSKEGTGRNGRIDHLAPVRLNLTYIV